MFLKKNGLLEWLDGEKPGPLMRILWFAPDADQIALIQVEGESVLPVFYRRDELETALAKGEARLVAEDPFSHLQQPETAISTHHRAIRNAAWEVIGPLVENETGRIFFPADRGPLVQQTHDRTGRSVVTIYKYLRRYWQGGQIRNALLPLFNRCGGPGKIRRTTSAKRGRPARLTQAAGVNVDEAMREKFRRGIRIFYQNRSERSFQDAYQLTLERFFHKGYEQHNGAVVKCLPPATELPTFGQFRYWYEKEHNLRQTLTARKGSRQYHLKHREVLGDSAEMAHGPGSFYQIDATVGDIYLVSSFDRSRIIGRPVIYMVVDVFSRMITGLSVGLEGPSWLGALLALENACSEKVSFCKEFGIEISGADWPCAGLPEALLSDRGELFSQASDNLVNALNIRISTAPPYRADWKGIVERSFRTTNEKVIQWLPGAVRAPRERGETDYRLDATLDLQQFRKLLILCALDHNHSHRMDWFRLTEGMMADRVEPYPLELWEWGIRCRSGSLRPVARDILRLNLLPSDEATVTHRGIRFRGLLYTTELAVQEQWFVKARHKGTWRISVAYDPRLLDVIYLRMENGKRLERCVLLGAEKAFQGRDWHDALDVMEIRKQAAVAARSRTQRSKAAFHAQVEQIVAEAMEQTERHRRPGQSRQERITGIRANRKAEQDQERDQNAWELGAPPPASCPAEVVMLPAAAPDETDPDYLPPPRPLAKLRQLREEMWKNDK
ncbi:MAG: transposase family protein [Blastocatellia bacterium]|nr:transposase family protein [Blastocatellia bacterium]